MPVFHVHPFADSRPKRLYVRLVIKLIGVFALRPILVFFLCRMVGRNACAVVTGAPAS